VTLLHVEDERTIRVALRRALEAFGISVLSADGVSAARLVLAERRDVTGALLDVLLGDGSGLELYEWITVHRPDLARRVAFLTGSEEDEFEPVAAYGCPVLTKPFDFAAVLRLAAEWGGAADAGRA
jgi:DNA-binding response OmpR family regulator